MEENNVQNVAAEAQAVSADDKNMGIICAILQFAGFIIPFGGLIAPLILWIMKKESSAYIDKLGKEVVNFEISFTIYGAVAFLLWFIFIGMIILPIIGILWFVFVIIGLVKACNGEVYRYPMTIRFIK